MCSLPASFTAPAPQLARATSTLLDTFRALIPLTSTQIADVPTLSMQLVNGQWQPHQASQPRQGSAVAPAPAPATLRPVTPSRVEDYAWRCRVRLRSLSGKAVATVSCRKCSLTVLDAPSPSASLPSPSRLGSSSCSASVRPL